MGGTTVWRGQTMDDRSAERRKQLIDVCLDLLGTGGAASATLRAVCRAAKLSPRYFYENFSNREELLIATYDHVEANLLERLLVADPGQQPRSIKSVLEVCALYFEEDPRRARILLREPMSDETLRVHQSGRSPVFLTSLIPALEGAAKRMAPRSPEELEVVGRGVTVNVVAPGYVATGSQLPFEAAAAQAGPIGRSATPDEIASCVTFLAHKSASFVTGAVLIADGGHNLPETWGRS